MAPVEPMIPSELASEYQPPQPRRSLSQSGSESGLDTSFASLARTPSPLTSMKSSSTFRARFGLMGVARRTLGISLLLVTVFLWTASNFLASYIFSDHTYDKPFFVVYINTSVFAISLIPMVLQYIYNHGITGLVNRVLELWREQKHAASPLRKAAADEEDAAAGERLLDNDEASSSSLEALSLAPETSRNSSGGGGGGAEEKLSLRETAWLSLEFCMLWFAANYFASACLEYTSVGSVTILTSTSSVWTLVFCAVMRVEGFSVRKLGGVLASLAGVVLISSVDLSGSSDDNRGNFPHKTRAQIAIGDSMAFFSAIIYGLYVTVMKRNVGNEDRVNMPLFFGLVGLFNVLLLWPGFFILHFTGIEPFAFPPSGKVWAIIMLNSISSFISDMSWAFAMLLTTPLVVTVGLSLTIPLSLIGEMIQYAQYSSWVYWIGAGIVFMSFLFINHESKDEENPKGSAVSENGTRSAVIRPTGT